jgi:hypothetical protein
MTTSFFSANTQYNPIHDVDTVFRTVDPSDPTAPLRHAPASAAGWFVSGIAALVGLATFSIVGAYALDDFTKPPTAASMTAPSVSISLAPSASVAPPPAPSTPVVEQPTETPHVVLVPPHRSAPAPVAPALSPEVTTPPPPPQPAPTWPPPHWDPPSHWHPPTISPIPNLPPFPKDPASRPAA